MMYLFQNHAGFQKGMFLKIVPAFDKFWPAIVIGNNESDVRYQLTDDEIKDMIKYH